MAEFNVMQDALVHCDKDKLVGLVNAALKEDISAADILNQGLIAGMDIVGEKMENGDMFIPEVLMSAQAMGECVAILKPLLGESDTTGSGVVIIGTVKGDLHDIGKNLVGMMMEGAGFEIHDLGINNSLEEYIGALEAEDADILGMSALL
ncbi:MAG: B12-binding domain-containing protein, partial [Desulfobacula sp.]|nr:B12-binding domain-containing protein [Desulfobacula sp.]